MTGTARIPELRARLSLFDQALIHPKAYDDFRRLIHGLHMDNTYGKLGTLFAPWETYRHPFRFDDRAHMAGQAFVLDPHCFGLAVSFAVMENGRPSFAANKPWHELADRARGWGYVEEQNRVVHHFWEDFRACLQSM